MELRLFEAHMLFALHVPDHTLSTETTLIATLATIVVAALAVRITLATASRPSLGMIAATAAFVFAVQAVNFPLLDGRTSGHLLGGAAAAILLGPVFGAATVAAVLVLQALLLGDGGVTALGANIWNMAIIGPVVGYAAFTAVRRLRSDSLGTIFAAAAAGWASSVAAASLCAVELAASGLGSPGTIFAELVGPHLLLGLVEGVATVAIVLPVLQPVIANRRWQLAPLVVAAVLAVALMPISSERPDSLEATIASTVFTK